MLTIGESRMALTATRLAALVIGLMLTLGVPSTSQASTITYVFRVTATAGPLSGAVETGAFTYDTSSIVLNGMNDGTNLLTALNFIWNGINYDQTTANTGRLTFDADGNLTLAIFGNSNSAGVCSVTPMTNEWCAEAFIGGTVPGDFLYSTSDFSNIAGGTVIAELITPGSVAEPTALALLATSIGVLMLFMTVIRGAGQPQSRWSW